MKDIVIDTTSDWHIGHPNGRGDYPTEDEIHESLDNAVKRGVDAYIIAGDFTNQGSVEGAQKAASILKPFIEQGLLVIGIVGNHDFINDDGVTIPAILAQSGVKMLEGQSLVVSNKTGDRQLTVLGVSGEIGYSYDNWWRTDGWDKNGREKAYAAAARHRDALRRGLAESTTQDVLVVTHRSIVPDTIGTRARETNFVSPQMQDFSSIIDSFATTKRITSISGHDHDVFPWEGFPSGRTISGVETNNVSSPVRKRRGLRLAKRKYF